MRVLPREEGRVRAELRMRRALEIARTETPAGDIPIAAVIYDADGVELAWGTNRREADGDPTAHAEVVALRAAVGRHGDGWRLTGCELVVTVEPCIMCAGAIVNARVGSVVYGAAEPKTGAAGSLVDVLREPPGLHHPQVRAGVLAEEATGLMTGFFSELRG
ncbi:tRNA-specific adenosine deaminase [Corynebacterium guangdongense]|nr:tRNA-specific adenosine deaminase [Corynebacterium guangdongense]